MCWNELQEYLDSGKVLEERGILVARHLGGHRLQIWFEDDLDVSIFELDFLPILSSADAGEALAPLLDETRFSQVIGRYNLTWNDPETGEYNDKAIDIAPEAIRWLCEKKGTVVRKSV